MIPRLLVIVVLSLAVVFVGCSSSGSGDGVSMTNGQRFDPDEITIKAGATLQWSNDTAESHTVTAYDGAVPQGAEYFASGGFDDEAAARDDLSGGLIKQGDTFEVTFDEPGTYEYFCIPHESSGMKGRVVVEP